MSRFLRSLAAIFTPPFQGLWLVVVIYFVWAHMVYPHNDVMRGNLPDPDDYMYLAQVLDWIKGQGWYDNIQHRLDPPSGTPIHFSRFAQIPLALGIFFFKTFGLKPHGAAMLTALIEPLVLLGTSLTVIKRIAAHLIPKDWAGASAYVALFAVGFLFEFMPGHVDHHGLVILLILTSVVFVLRLLDDPKDLRAAGTAGLVLALAMTVALECLPWVLLLSAWLGIWSMRKGGASSKSGACFALSFLTGSLLCLALTRPSTTFFEADVLTYSIVYVVLAAGIALPFIGTAFVPQSMPAVRWGMGSILAIMSGFLFLHRFPELAMGPYGGIDPQLLPILLDEVEEAKPILQTVNGGLHMLDLMGMGFIATFSAFYFTYNARSRLRWKWSLLTLLLTAAMGLTIFYQYRFLGMEAALAVVPLTALLYKGWRQIGEMLKGRKKVFAEIGLLLLVGPLPAVLIPSLFNSRSFNTGVLLFAVDAGRTPCDMSRLQYVLRDPAGLGDKPHLILSMIERGPELLFRTEDTVLAAPFHMNVQGNINSARFLSTSYPVEAENIARRRKVDLVIVCRALPDLYRSAPHAPQTMAERLVSNAAPEWLEHVPVQGLDNFVIYRVLPAKL